jgi:OOP family OmpA-OmpF porin
VRLFRFALLCLAAPAASAGIAQAGSDQQLIVPPPIVVTPVERPPTVSDLPIYNDNLIRIYFDYDSAALVPSAVGIVDLIATRALRCPYPVIAIAGHVDTATRRSRARSLSRRMAETIRQALISRGIHPGDIRTTGYGASRLAIATGPNVRQPFNRRVEIEMGCNRTARGRLRG